MSELDRKYAEKLLFTKDKEMKVSGGVIPLHRNKASIAEAEGILSNRKPNIRQNPVDRGFDDAFPAALEAEHTRRTSPLGKYSPRAAIMDSANKAINLFVGKDEASGRRHAQKAAKMVKDPSNWMGQKLSKPRVTQRGFKFGN